MYIGIITAYSLIHEMQIKELHPPKIDFFPVHKAKCLVREDKDETKNQLDKLNTKVDLVLLQFEKEV